MHGWIDEWIDGNFIQLTNVFYPAQGLIPQWKWPEAGVGDIAAPTQHVPSSLVIPVWPSHSFVSFRPGLAANLSILEEEGVFYMVISGPRSLESFFQGEYCKLLIWFLYADIYGGSSLCPSEDFWLHVPEVQLNLAYVPKGLCWCIETKTPEVDLPVCVDDTRTINSMTRNLS